MAEDSPAAGLSDLDPRASPASAVAPETASASSGPCSRGCPCGAGSGGCSTSGWTRGVLPGRGHPRHGGGHLPGGRQVRWPSPARGIGPPARPGRTTEPAQDAEGTTVTSSALRSPACSPPKDRRRRLPGPRPSRSSSPSRSSRFSPPRHRLRDHPHHDDPAGSPPSPCSALPRRRRSASPRSSRASSSSSARAATRWSGRHRPRRGRPQGPAVRALPGLAVLLHPREQPHGDHPVRPDLAHVEVRVPARPRA